MVRTIINSLLFLFVFGQSVLAGEISSLDFKGLNKTKESYLRGLINCKVGQDFSDERFQEDIRLLRNLNLFFHVEGKTSLTITNDYELTITIQEATYVYPVFWMSGFKDELKLIAGVNHFNLFGKAHSCGLTYQFYDRHSFYFFYDALRHSNNKTGHEFAVGKYSTVEPLYFEDSMRFYDFDNYSIKAGAHYWLGSYLNIGLGSKYMYESYVPTRNFNNVPEIRFNKFQVHGALRYNRIENIYERQNGIRADIYGEYIYTEGFPEATFIKSIGEVYYFKTYGSWGNLAIRARVGIATNNEGPFSPFVLDGMINARGIGNRVERGTAEISINSEYRFTCWRQPAFSLQPIVYVDFATVREPGKSFETLFNDTPNLFSGIGIRFNLNKWYKTTLRIDYGVNIAATSQHGVTFGIGQFF